MKRIIDFCEKGLFKLVVFINFFVVLRIDRISTEYVPRMKVLILQILCTAIVENTRAQYFDNLIRKLYACVVNNDNTVMHQVCQYKCFVSGYIL